MKEVKLLYPPKGPLVFKRMIDEISQEIKKGDVVRLIDKDGDIFGYAFYNPDSNIVLRIITRTRDESFDVDEYIYQSIKKAYMFRKIFSLPSLTTNAYRLIHDWGDGLSGVVCDVFGEYTVCEIYSYAYFKRMNLIKKMIMDITGCRDVFFVSNSYIQTMERFKMSEGEKKIRIKIKENDIFFEVCVGEGYKTGFFCDQRENRSFFSKFVNGKSVLDLFSYTGGFGIYAKKHGASHVSCVELDEKAVVMLKRNANINGVKIDVVRADAFNYLKQMISNSKKFDVVVCDPYKFISSKENMEEGLKKYHDINRLALECVEKNGILLSCSCSGMLDFDSFVSIIRKAASSAKRLVKIFKKSGAGPDHPYMVNYPEGEYLKAVWCYVE